MKVFLTGANGMLGSYITRELLKRGYSVKGLIQPGRENHNLDGLDMELVYGDITDRDFIFRETAGCDALIHTAASTQIYPRRNPGIWKVNYEGVKILCEAVQANGLKRMVHIGTANSFAEGSKDRPGDESGAYDCAKFGMDYMDSKYEVQQYLLKLHQDTNFPVVIINPGYMIGPHDAGPTSGQMLLSFVKGQLPGYTEGGKSFVYSGDVAVAAVNALDQGQTGQCYIAGGENLSYKEFLNKAANVAKIPFKLNKVPGILVLLIGFFASLIARISGKKPKISFGMARISLIGQYYSNKKISTGLHMPQTPIETAIKESLDWFRINGYID